MFVPHASKIWRKKSYGQDYTKFWAFWRKKNRVFLNSFSQSVDAILKDVSVAETII